MKILVDNSVGEGRRIEYKQELPSNSNEEKKEFLADISSFANASGGDLLYGIQEEKGIILSIEGLKFDDIDQEILRLDAIIISGIEPRIPSVLIKSVILSNSKSVLLIRVSKSWISRHRVVFKGHDKFYSRSSNGKYPLNVDELRIAFNFSQTTQEKIRNFRIDRISNIVAEETPIPLYDENSPIIILHIIFINSFNPAQTYDINQIDACCEFIRPISSGRYMSHRYNLDGRVNYAVIGEKEETWSYAQVFINGIIEVVWKQLAFREQNENVLYGDYIEEEIIKTLPMYLQALSNLDTGLPIFIFLSIINVKGFSMPVNFMYKLVNRVQTIDRDVLIIPEAIIDSYNPVVPQILKPCFDSMWNAAGFACSPNYDNLGNWSKRR